MIRILYINNKYNTQFLLICLYIFLFILSFSIMDKTLRFFSSGQTKNVSSSFTENNTNKGLALGQTNGFRDSGTDNGKHIVQNHHAIDMKRKDSDNFFYIL